MSILRLMKSSAPELRVIILGLLGSIVYGAVYPTLSVLYGEVLKVYASPSGEIINRLHLFASLFIVMGVVVGCASFVQVRYCDDFSGVLQF